MSQPPLYKPFANYECKKKGFKKSMVPIITVYQSWAGLKSKLERPIDLSQPKERERERAKESAAQVQGHLWSCRVLTT